MTLEKIMEKMNLSHVEALRDETNIYAQFEYFKTCYEFNSYVDKMLGR